MLLEERNHQLGHRIGGLRVWVVPGAVDHRGRAHPGRHGRHDRVALGLGVGEVGVQRAHDDQGGALDVGQLRGGVGGRIEGLHELGHPAGFAQLGGQRGHVAGVVGGLGRVGQVEVAQPQAQAAEHPRAGQQEDAPAVTPDPQQPAQAVLHLPGERVDLDDPADLLRSRRRGDGAGPARDGVPDDDRGPAQVADQGEQIAAATSVRVIDAQAMLDSPCPRRSALTTR